MRVERNRILLTAITTLLVSVPAWAKQSVGTHVPTVSCGYASKIFNRPYLVSHKSLSFWESKVSRILQEDEAGRAGSSKKPMPVQAVRDYSLLSLYIETKPEPGGDAIDSKNIRAMDAIARNGLKTKQLPRINYDKGDILGSIYLKGVTFNDDPQHRTKTPSKILGNHTLYKPRKTKDQRWVQFVSLLDTVTGKGYIGSPLVGYKHYDPEIVRAIAAFNGGR